MIKKASRVLYAILRMIFRPYLKLRFNLTADSKTAKNLKPPFLVISNHTTVHDQFIVGLTVKHAPNMVASDSMFRQRGLGWVLRNIARAVPITKGTADMSAVKNIMNIIKQGGCVALFPEGNRTFYGETCNFKPTIGKLAKRLNVPLVIMNIVGGFSTAPRYAYKTSKGKMYSGVKRIYSPEELKAMTDDEINDIIAKSIYFNEYEYNKEKQIKFKGRHKAEYMESVLFYCPDCGQWNTLSSKGNFISCSHCGMKSEVTKTGFLSPIKENSKVPDNLIDWSNLQLNSVKAFDYSKFIDTPVFSDSKIKLFKCKRAKGQKLVGKGKITLYGDRLEIAGKVLPISSIDNLAIQSIKNFQIYTDNGDIFLVKGNKGDNLVKYMVCVYRIKHIFNKDEENDYYGY